jgi:transcriptional regulator with GAF, ATPase, and Fis domain
MGAATTLYRHFDWRGRLLYVGISYDALRRANEHFKDKSWAKDVARFEVQHFGSREAAVAAEKAAIACERPLYNVASVPRQRGLRLQPVRPERPPKSERKAVDRAAPSPRPPRRTLPGVQLDLAQHMRDVESAILIEALSQHRGNRTAAGRRLGLSLRQMRYRMDKLGVTA